MKLAHYAAGLLIALAAISCKKTTVNNHAERQAKETTKSPNRSESNYIQDFYGINVPHVFIVENRADETTSLKLTLTWDADGVASYTTETVPLDANAYSHRVFLPDTEFDKEKSMLTPTHTEVKTVALVYQDGGVSEHINGGGVFYCWKCGASPAYWNPMGWWYCLGTPGQPSPYTPAYVVCGSYGVMDDVIVYQTN
jgi:hypothetical protein